VPAAKSGTDTKRGSERARPANGDLQGASFNRSPSVKTLRLITTICALAVTASHLLAQGSAISFRGDDGGCWDVVVANSVMSAFCVNPTSSPPTGSIVHGGVFDATGRLTEVFNVEFMGVDAAGMTLRLKATKLGEVGARAFVDSYEANSKARMSEQMRRNFAISTAAIHDGASQVADWLSFRLLPPPTSWRYQAGSYATIELGFSLAGTDLQTRLKPTDVQ
jgi:hypothetical protein